MRRSRGRRRGVLLQLQLQPVGSCRQPARPRLRKGHGRALPNTASTATAGGMPGRCSMPQMACAGRDAVRAGLGGWEEVAWDGGSCAGP